MLSAKILHSQSNGINKGNQQFQSSSSQSQSQSQPQPQSQSQSQSQSRSSPTSSDAGSGSGSGSGASLNARTASQLNWSKSASYHHLPSAPSRGSDLGGWNIGKDDDHDQQLSFSWSSSNRLNQHHLLSDQSHPQSQSQAIGPLETSKYLTFAGPQQPSNQNHWSSRTGSDRPRISIFSSLESEPIYQNPPIYKRPSQDDSLALLLPLLILLSTLLLMLLLFIILIVIVRKRSRISLGDSTLPIDVGREEDLESSNSTSQMGGSNVGGISGIEERWLETVPQSRRLGYLRAKDFLLSNPPNSFNTDITLQQYLSIQEKGVSAWSFEPDYENNPSVFVENRTEISFLGDGVGMNEEEGGGCNVQSNLPLPKLNEVYYWEAKMFTLPEGCNVSVGLATKPFPSFRLPGWSKYSIGYFSQDGFKSHNYPFFSQSYGPAYIQGDVIGCGYRPRTGTVFFTRNGKKLDDAFVGLNRYNLFPTIGANNSSEIHINLGQAGFVFIEANVKKWGLAPMVGTRAPPPAYGMERGSVLIEASRNNRVLEERRQREERENHFFPTEIVPPSPPPSIGNGDNDLIGNGMEVNRRENEARENVRGSERRYGTLNRNFRSPSDTTPSRSSPLRRSVTRMNTEGNLSERNASSPEEEMGSNQSDQSDQDQDEHSPRPRAISSASSSEGQNNNPPTPGRLDISLHALDSNGHSTSSPSSNSNSNRNSTHSNRTIRAGDNGSYFPSNSSSSSSSNSRNGGNGNIRRSNSPQPPSYDSLAQEREREISRNNSQGHGVRDFANSLVNLLSERGLLNPVNSSSSDAPTSSPRQRDDPPAFNHHVASNSISSYEANTSQNIQIENDLDQSTRENTARNGRSEVERRSWSDLAWGLIGRS